MFDSNFTVPIELRWPFRIRIFLITEFFKKPVNIVTENYSKSTAMFFDWAKNCKWFQILDLVEFVATSVITETPKKRRFISACNEIFEVEKVGYRFVRSQIVPITDSQEIAELEEVLGKSAPFSGMRSHLTRALELYSNRENPDYRNSIKEAISAVESVCKVISKKPKATLADALKEIEKSGSIRPALKESLIKLYGYTSDKQGIRHALIDNQNV